MLKANLKFFIAFFLFSSVSFASAGSFIHPLGQIAAPSCRFQAWSGLSADCKMSLPRITNADYDKYKDDKLMRRVYSVLWGATYDYGWDVGMGSHEGVDIATSEGTPVQAIGDGTVLTAGKLSGWGNAVTIKHSLGSGKYLYSNYAHLSKILVNKGDIVSAGTNIGEVGNTGNSYGNHLHFQLDITNQNHPYYFLNCGKGVDPVALVNQGLCRDYLTTNTIDPILFLEKQEISFSAPEQLPGKIQELQKDTKVIQQKAIKSREQILDEEIQEFLNWHNISLSQVLTGNNAELGKTYTLRISVTDKRGIKFTGSLPVGGLMFDYDKKGLRLFPEQLIAIDNGSRDFTVTGLKSGNFIINLKLGKKTVTSTWVNVFKPGEFSKPTSASLLLKNSVMLGEKKLSAIVMKTKYGTNQLDIPYDGKYVLKSTKGKVKFCNVSRVASRVCNYSDLVEELSFTFADTYRGVLVFNMVAQDYMPIELGLYRVGDKKLLAKSARDITIENPLGIDKSYPYFTEAIAGLKKSFIDLNQGYLTQDREIVSGQMKSVLRNYFSYLSLSAGTDSAKKVSIQKARELFEQKVSSLGEYDSVSRIQFATLLTDVFGTKLSYTTDKKWLDEDGVNKDVMTTLRVRYNFTWRDSFGENYFQPDKKILIGEALYLLQTFDGKREYFAMNRK